MSTKFPSGSYWGAREVQAVRFASEPDMQDFQDFDCDGRLSDENNEVMSRLSAVFSIPIESLEDEVVIEPFIRHAEFYAQLALILQPNPPPDPMSKPLTRSGTRYNSSSPFTDQERPASSPDVPADFGSPDSSPAAGGAKRKIRYQTTTPSPQTVARLFSTDADERPTQSAASALLNLCDEEEAPRKIQLSPSKTSSQSQPMYDGDRISNATNPELGNSSSLDSSYKESSTPSAPSDSGPESDADVLEGQVNEMFSLFLKIICAEHDTIDGLFFSAGFSGSLVLVIDGEAVTTRPDYTVSVRLNGRSPIGILDYEVRSVFSI